MPAEYQEFEADASSNAYEKQVDKLLKSQHFGEKWASMWMDLARYADTKGYEKDDARTIWKYRDYVISAFNQNKPYDQFLKEQLAGDRLGADAATGTMTAWPIVTTATGTTTA